MILILEGGKLEEESLGQREKNGTQKKKMHTETATSLKWTINYFVHITHPY